MVRIVSPRAHPKAQVRELGSLGGGSGTTGRAGVGGETVRQRVGGHPGEGGDPPVGSGLRRSEVEMATDVDCFCDGHRRPLEEVEPLSAEGGASAGVTGSRVIPAAATMS